MDHFWTYYILSTKYNELLFATNFIQTAVMMKDVCGFNVLSVGRNGDVYYTAAKNNHVEALV